MTCHAKSCKGRLSFVPMATPGEEVRLARLARGMSQVALAAAAGVDAGTIGRIERGIGEPTKLGMVQAYLGIGPYAEEHASVGVDLSTMEPRDLVRHLVEVATELERRLAPGNTPDFTVFDTVNRPNLREHLGKYRPGEDRLEG